MLLPTIGVDDEDGLEVSVEMGTTTSSVEVGVVEAVELIDAVPVLDGFELSEMVTEEETLEDAAIDGLGMRAVNEGDSVVETVAEVVGVKLTEAEKEVESETEGVEDAVAVGVIDGVSVAGAELEARVVGVEEVEAVGVNELDEVRD